MANFSDQNSISSVLHNIGFTPNESTTYLGLLDLENASIRKIAERININRGTTYEALKALVLKGLVRVHTVGSRVHYNAESPEKIYDIMRDKRKELWHAQQSAQKLVPALLAKKAHPKGKPLVRYFEDDEGIVAVLRDVLQTCRGTKKPEYYVYSSLLLRQYIYRKFPDFTERRIEEGISVKVIAIGEGGSQAAASERKWLPEPPGGEASSYVIIYGDKFAQISISQNQTPYAVVIEDSGTAAMQRLLFERLYEKL